MKRYEPNARLDAKAARLFILDYLDGHEPPGIAELQEVEGAVEEHFDLTDADYETTGSGRIVWLQKLDNAKAIGRKLRQLYLLPPIEGIVYIVAPESLPKASGGYRRKCPSCETSSNVSAATCPSCGFKFPKPRPTHERRRRLPS